MENELASYDKIIMQLELHSKYGEMKKRRYFREREVMEESRIKSPFATKNQKAKAKIEDTNFKDRATTRAEL